MSELRQIDGARTWQLKARPLTNEAVEASLQHALEDCAQRFARLAMRRIRRGGLSADRIRTAARAALQEPAVQRAVLASLDERLANWSWGDDLEEIISNIPPDETPFAEGLRRHD